MIKSVFAATAALSMSAGAALAGPYVNVETNAGWVGDDYSAATTDLHVGYEGDLGAASYYVQAGPAIIAVDGEVVMTRDTATATPTTPRSQKKSSPKKPAANVPAAKPKSTFAAAIAQARRNNPSLEFGK